MDKFATMNCIYYPIFDSSETYNGSISIDNQ